MHIILYDILTSAAEIAKIKRSKLVSQPLDKFPVTLMPLVMAHHLTSPGIWASEHSITISTYIFIKTVFNKSGHMHGLIYLISMHNKFRYSSLSE